MERLKLFVTDEVRLAKQELRGLLLASCDSTLTSPSQKENAHCYQSRTNIFVAAIQQIFRQLPSPLQNQECQTKRHCPIRTLSIPIQLQPVRHTALQLQKGNRPSPNNSPRSPAKAGDSIFEIDHTTVRAD